MYEDRTQNYDPEIHEEYLIHLGFYNPSQQPRLCQIPVINRQWNVLGHIVSYLSLIHI